MILPRHLINNILLNYIPNLDKIKTKNNRYDLLYQLKEIINYKNLHIPKNISFSKWWFNEKMDYFNMDWKYTKFFSIQEYRERTTIFKGQAYPSFFERKFPMKKRLLFLELEEYLDKRGRWNGNEIKFPIGFYRNGIFRYNTTLYNGGLEKIFLE